MAPHRLPPLAITLALTLASMPASATDETTIVEQVQPTLQAASTATVNAETPDNPGAEEEEAEPVSRARHVNLDEPISNAEASQSASEPEPEPEPAPPATAPAEQPGHEPPPAQSDTSDEQAPAGPAPATETRADAPLADEQSVTTGTGAAEPAGESQTAEPSEETAPPPFILLGSEVPAATSTRLAWAPSQSFEGIYSATPVLVVNGAQPGPVLCLTAAVHGDELNGVETVRRVLYNLDPEKLRGTVVGVPIVNLQGFHRGSRYLSDRRDLNRYFPGDPGGSSASRIAYSFFHEIIQHCSAVVDLHTGSFYRTNLPQLRGDLGNPKVVKLTEGFGSTVVLHSDGAQGTLRRAAVEAGIPAVTLEAGAPMVLSEDNVAHSVKGVRTLLNHLDMLSKFRLWGDPEPIYYNSTWQRAPEGGIVFSKVLLGQTVRKGDLLGTVTNPITNVRTEIRSSYNGRIIGMALNQVVQPGFATHHIGIEAPEEQISPPEDVEIPAEEAASDPAPEQAADSVATAPDPNSPRSQPAALPDSPPPGPQSGNGGTTSNVQPAANRKEPTTEEDNPPLQNAEDEDFEASPQPLDGNEDDMAEAT
ncbi:succinylglutamate desuccinylase/aspartoacylase family protein [Parahaliea maris]|uniref:succinylglutamate desuccinylase/aspartoacylase family protein n=1 Tax=Parahaliea maris TaxID=2716870 RepID=UPI001F3FABEA|nr:succinylglutamate desuccinylase/aspartoacylase family protein [Parahaliea maris]